MSASAPRPHTPVLVETSEEIAYELRAAEGATWTGSRLVVGIVAFAFASLAFAYFYLRSANNDNLWRPTGAGAPSDLGAAVFAFTVAAGALAVFGNRRLRSGDSVDWMVAGWLTVTAGLTVCGLQIFELTRLSFFPGSSGYASCFIAWAAMNVVLVLSATYWTETLLARALRLRRALTEEGATSATPPVERLHRANSDGSTLFWGFVAVVGAFFWILFYVI